jgi:predicted nucleic acid-binding Zn ribbon protein
MTPDEHAEHARSLADNDLEIIVSTKIPMSQEAIAARVELARRERKRTFWRKDIVAWIALALSVVSIVISVFFRRG